MSEVNRLVAGMLSEYFPDIHITGEISNLRRYPSGHLYFALKDEAAQIDAVCFRAAAHRLKFQLEDGLQVIGRGRLDLYVARGKYQIVLDSMEPVGLGALQKAYEQLKKKLAAEGLFDAERKRPLPRLPRVVGIVTSPAGAAIHDMLRTLRLHGAKVKVLLWPAQVQGDGAASEVSAGIRGLNEQGESEVIVAGRGGGSIEDLWCFNEEEVVRAIAESTIPVVSGVGHETDSTIADFVADVRAATPTAAAQSVARGWTDLAQDLEHQLDKLIAAQEQVILDCEQRTEVCIRHRGFDVVRGSLIEAGLKAERRLSAIERQVKSGIGLAGEALGQSRSRLEYQHPAAGLERSRRRLLETLSKAEGRAWHRLTSAQDQSGRLAAKLDALSPLASLGRGYSICRKPDGTVVRSTGQVTSGEHLAVMVTDGEIACRIDGVEPDGRHPR